VRKKLFAVTLGCTLLTGLLLAGCGGGSSTPGAQRITVKAQDTFAFDPATLTAQVGQTVEINLENVGVLEHNLVIDELSVSAGPVQGGQSSSASFTPTAAGTLVYYCNVPGHREAGMEGTLTVTE
jgi:plastocyanin